VIQSSESSVAISLAIFTTEGFLVQEQESVYRYEPQRPELEQGLSALAKEYQERRVAVIEAIYSRPPDPVRTFADAFKLRREK
jgi:hypothetical protein